MHPQDVEEARHLSINAHAQSSDSSRMYNISYQ